MVTAGVHPGVVTHEHVVDADANEDEGGEEMPLAEEVQVEDVVVDKQGGDEGCRHAEQRPEGHPARARIHPHDDRHEQQTAEGQPQVHLPTTAI